jgi:RNA polymerase sigma factor for flagellar operon FliA
MNYLEEKLELAESCSFEKGSEGLEKFEKYFPRAKKIVGIMSRCLPSVVEVGDLENVGAIGLMRAIEKYDSRPDVDFMTYASYRIKGAVLSDLRGYDFLSRGMRKKVKTVEKTFFELCQELGREPDDLELAGHMKLPLKNLDEIRATSDYFVGLEDVDESYLSNCFSAVYSDKNISNNVLDDLCLEESKRILTDEMGKLSEKERTVLSMYYNDELTMKEIGARFGITDSRISQIHANALTSLKKGVEYVYESSPSKVALDELLEDEFVGVRDICDIGGITMPQFYHRIRKNKIPKRGRLYLLNCDTSDILFKPKVK